MSTSTRKAHTRISRENRAQIRYYLAHDVPRHDIRTDLHISDSTIKRARNNAWNDKLEDDAKFVSVKQEEGVVLAGAPGEREVIELSSDSEEEEENEQEEQVDGKRKTRGQPNYTPYHEELHQPENPRPIPHEALGEKPSTRKSQKRVRFDFADEDQQQKRQKTVPAGNGSPHRGSARSPELDEPIAFREPHPGNGASFRIDFSQLQNATAGPSGGSAVGGGSANSSRPRNPSLVGGSSAAVKPIIRVSRPPVANTSGWRPTAIGSSVNTINMERLSLDPPPSHINNPPPQEAEIAKLRGPRLGDTFKTFLGNLGLEHCTSVLKNAGFNSVEDIQVVLKKNLAKEKTREEIRAILMPADGGGMVLRDWLTLSDSLVPNYGESRGSSI
ncbi:hypothetical protein C8R43DRAFT_992011 [Mycena crocata]|nr:hypothetical protein C8R43DRAFT_992011 [Mycena crocata]